MKAHLGELFSSLELRAEAIAGQDIAQMFLNDPDRLSRLSFSAAGIHLDVSKNLLESSDLGSLTALAEAAGVSDATRAMFRGDIINHTEQRAVLHTALRAGSAGCLPELADKLEQVRQVRNKLAEFVEHVHTGQRRGASGEAFTDVVNIGIGGSHLGPQLACDALRYSGRSHLNCHFLANVDGGEFERITAALNPATTLFIVASKSFTTVETRLNAESARAWLTAALPGPGAVKHHFVAVSANPSRAVDFGIDADNVYPMWDWVGGRYSMWSAIGMPIALQYGNDIFAELLDGAAAMDRHFSSAPLAVNLPVVLALLGIWNTQFLNAESYAVIPYDDRLRFLPDYLQQLEMESNGKRVDRQGQPLNHPSAPVTWGSLGTNAQHAFFQLLHQGTRFIPVDFIVALQHPVADRSHHDMLVANCFAQAEGLMNGRHITTFDSDTRLANHRESPGRRPNTLLSVDALTPATLGSLIALYEHKTFVQSVIWDINAFDQWGVELGKELADTILAELSDHTVNATHDPSTAALIKRYRQLNPR